ncbi:uncharacterized protein LOC110268397 [Arachis ipaensis]|uniref:uncharacterized protein LOC110268397 n=1 Tax=Arachis ipaensis TaxID=130454 RepID=UPI000A2B6ED9|nr:uncharacterized protein LOC110268397 [Arachis ipaensis]
MLDSVTGVGPGYKGPSYDKLRVHLLDDLKRECQMLVDSYRSAWREIGCTLMADGWTDQRQRTLINFLVYFKYGKRNASMLCHLFFEVIEWIGLNNIVHVVTDNATNYIVAGRLISQKYENIYWSPCATHCLNLILKDISSMAHISNLASHASKITVFVYNHSYFTGHKLRSANGRAVSAIILDSKFWDDCFTACKLVSPLIKLLRIVDANDKPSLGYVYEEMLRIEDAIKEMFK